MDICWISIRVNNIPLVPSRNPNSGNFPMYALLSAFFGCARPALRGQTHLKTPPLQEVAPGFLSTRAVPNIHPRNSGEPRRRIRQRRVASPSSIPRQSASRRALLAAVRRARSYDQVRINTHILPYHVFGNVAFQNETRRRRPCKAAGPSGAGERYPPSYECWGGLRCTDVPPTELSRTPRSDLGDRKL